MTMAISEMIHRGAPPLELAVGTISLMRTRCAAAAVVAAAVVAAVVAAAVVAAAVVAAAVVAKLGASRSDRWV